MKTMKTAYDLAYKDFIKKVEEFVVYCKLHGSSHAGFYYKNINSLIDKIVKIPSNRRSCCSDEEYYKLIILMTRCRDHLILGISQNFDYKKIYQILKEILVKPINMTGFSKFIA